METLLMSESLVDESEAVVETVGGSYHTGRRW
jgi:hypothetical protein